MKSLKSTEAIEYAKRWMKVKAKMKDLDDELALIKDYFKGQVKEGEAVLCGTYVIGATKFSRSSLDKERILNECGLPFVEKYSSTTEYVKLDIKKGGK